MIITCPNCTTRFDVAEQALDRPGGRKVKCARCAHVWQHTREAAEQEQASGGLRQRLQRTRATVMPAAREHPHEPRTLQRGLAGGPAQEIWERNRAQRGLTTGGSAAQQNWAPNASLGRMAEADAGFDESAEPALGRSALADDEDPSTLDGLLDRTEHGPRRVSLPMEAEAGEIVRPSFLDNDDDNDMQDDDDLGDPDFDPADGDMGGRSDNLPLPDDGASPFGGFGDPDDDLSAFGSSDAADEGFGDDDDGFGSVRDEPKKDGGLKVAVIAVLVLAILGGAGAAGWVYRDTLMEMVQGPPSEVLIIADLREDVVSREGRSSLVFRGTIRNDTKTRQVVPHLVGYVTDAQGLEIKRARQKPASDFLDPGESQRFMLEIGELPDDQRFKQPFTAVVEFEGAARAQ